VSRVWGVAVREWSDAVCASRDAVSLACQSGTAWPRPIGCLKLQVIFRRRGTNYRALLQKITYTDKASYDSTPPCIESLIPKVMTRLWGVPSCALSRCIPQRLKIHTIHTTQHLTTVAYQCDLKIHTTQHLTTQHATYVTSLTDMCVVTYSCAVQTLRIYATCCSVPSVQTLRIYVTPNLRRAP